MQWIEAQGLSLPALGFGTNRLRGEQCREAVLDALAIGYRFFDTAQRYENEEAVGSALSASPILREDLIVSTKLDLDLTAEQVVTSMKTSLRKLQTDYVDILLIHWPNRTIPLEETLAAMVALRDAGLIRAIGVSNFTTLHLEEALRSIPIFTNQVEYHPYLSQDKLIEFMQPRGIVLTAFAPIARGEVLDDPVLKEIASAHGKTVAQVCIRWLTQQPLVSTIPKASTHERRYENFDVFDFSLSSEEMNRISGLDRGRRIIDPLHAPAWDR